MIRSGIRPHPPPDPILLDEGMLEHRQHVYGDQRQQQPPAPLVDFVHDLFQPLADREDGRQVDPAEPFRAVAGGGAVGPAAGNQQIGRLYFQDAVRSVQCSHGRGPQVSRSVQSSRFLQVFAERIGS